jgi:putative endonuclease
MPTYWYFYMVRCCDRTLYTGVTTDLHRRLAAHNAGTACSYTRLKRPVQLAHWERFLSKSSALKREAEVKKLPKTKKELLVLGRRGTQLCAWHGIDGAFKPVARRNAGRTRG